MERPLRNLVVVVICVACYYIFMLYEIKLNTKIDIDADSDVNIVVIPGMKAKHLNRKNLPINGMKNILVWPPGYNPFHLLKPGQDSFIHGKCKYTNCFISHDLDHYMVNKKYYDAVIFSATSIVGTMTPNWLKGPRLWRQKYVFASLESSQISPISNPMFDNYFNWTWTYRLNSDVIWKYVIVYDLNGNIIGPSKDINWTVVYKPLRERVKIKLKQKSRAAAWFVSHCHTPSRREFFFKRVQSELERYGWSVDVYGACGSLYCRDIWCTEMLQKHYYFYFSFENSIDEDYVTEKLVTALNNLVVPVVYGGANYSRFLPPGSYLNARELGSYKLAKAMDNAIRNMSVYFEFFRWQNHYRFESSPRSTGVCDICGALNNETMMKTTSSHKYFRQWWNGKIRQRSYDVMLQVFLSSNSLLKIAANYNFSSLANRALMQSIQNRSTLFKDPIRN